MKRRIISFLVVLMVLYTNSVTVYATPESEAFVNREEMERQQRIDTVLEQLNEIVLEEKYESVVDKMGKSKGRNFKEKKGNRERQKKEYEKSLENLGMHKIDPFNSEDMGMLEEMQQDLALESTSTFSARANIYDSAPDFNMIANLYSLYIYNGTYKHDGVSYKYRYIRVVDDKGYNGLYYYQDNNLAVNIAQSKMQELLDYNFGYGLSSLLGEIPVLGGIIDWTLGGIFAQIEAVKNASTICSTRDELYGVCHISVTEMTYYFFYNDGWKHIGTSGNANVIRESYFYGNVDAKPVSERPRVEFTMSSGWIWHDFVERYVEVMDSMPNYCNIKDFGGLVIKGFNGVEYYYAPIFAGEPIDLI